MTRKPKKIPMSSVDPARYEIRVGYVSNFVVWQGDDPVNAFATLADAVDHFPSAKVSEGAKRKAEENGE